MVVDYLCSDEIVKYVRYQARLEKHLRQVTVTHRTDLDKGCPVCDGLINRMAPFAMISSERQYGLPEARAFNRFSNCHTDAQLSKMYLAVVPCGTQSAADLLLNAQYPSERIRTLAALQDTFFPHGQVDIRLLNDFALRKSSLAKDKNTSDNWADLARTLDDFGHLIN